MHNDVTIYNGVTSIINRKIEGEDFQLSKGLYESAIAITDSTYSRLFLVRKFCATSASYEWVLPGGHLENNGSSLRGCVILAAYELGFNICNDELKVLAYYYPCINYDISKHAIFTAKVSVEEENQLSSNAEVAKWFHFSEIDKMISESEIMDGRTILAYYKLLQIKNIG